MEFAYPIDLIPQADGNFLVSFPDIPEALTDGATKNEALSEAADCLIAALGSDSIITQKEM
jgi:antitoxin HicB